jgi:SPP1 family phage portal protein
VGVCICYVDEESKPKAAALNPKEAFVVYDDTVEHRPMFGVRWMDKFDEKGKKTGVTVYVHTKNEEQVYEGKTIQALAAVENKGKTHQFGGVPVVEFWNNAQERGDFEPVLSLIEAYDVLESDRVNDKQQFTDAVLLLTGCTLAGEEDEAVVEEEDGEEVKTKRDPRTPAQRLLEEKTLSLPDTEAKAEWLVKKSDESGAETLKNALKSDIHKMSMIPDMTDEHFAANASGVAMRYKLLGLEQLTMTKERWFREGLRARLRLFAHFLSVLAKGNLDPDSVKITFTRSLPVNETEIAAMVAQLSGIAPQKTLLGQLPFIEDVDEAVAELEAEKEKEAKRQAEAFGGQYADGNEPPADDEGKKGGEKRRDDAE